MSWQPIETAQRDGTYILVYGDPDEFDHSPGLYILRWSRDGHYLNGKPTGQVSEGWAGQGEPVDDEFNAFFKPTHWMHLPPLPEKDT